MKSNFDRRKIVLEIRQKQIQREKKIILFTSVLIVIITISIFMTIGYNKYGKDIYASAKVNESNESEEIGDILKNGHKKSDKKHLNNSGYLQLKDDPNAEDAMVVFKNTEDILKGYKEYPVRKDGNKVVYLTFDDGPSTESTSAIIDTLDKYNIKATFFVTGKSINECDKTKEELKEIVSHGNAIGNHTYSHDYSILYPNRTIDAKVFMYEIEKTNKALKDVLGSDFSTRAIRFPGGYWSWNGRSEVRSLIDEKKYAIIDWNALSKDAEGKQNKSADEILECVKQTTENLGPRADSIVVLMHDTNYKKESVKALPKIIEYYRKKGFQFKTIK